MNKNLFFLCRFARVCGYCCILRKSLWSCI